MKSENKMLLGIFGNPISHSLSPLIHNHLCEKFKLPYYYEAFEIFDLKGAVELLRTTSYFMGVSVTIPFKNEVINYIDEISPLAEKIGAVNTVIKKDGRLYGENTDAFGVMQTFSMRNLNLDEKKIAIIGAGGAAKSVVFAIIEKYNIKSLKICGISKEKENMKRFIKTIVEKTAFSNIENIIFSDEKYLVSAEDDVIINTTPVGMHPDIEKTIIEENTDSYKGKIFFDVIYNPDKTRFLKQAEKSGALIINGVDMFVFQALRQHFFWTGNSKASAEDIYEILPS